MASPETIRLSDRVLWIPGGVNTAIVHGDSGEAVIVDTGQDHDHGRRIRRTLEGYGLDPVAIVNTHAHADHFGGNAYLLKHFDLPVHAPVLEASLMVSPYLEPVYLYHGARPLEELTGKWLMAPPSPVDHHLEPGTLRLAGLDFEVIDTSGHAHRQMSLVTDDVLLAADALFGYEILSRYPILFGQDAGAQRASLTELGRLDVGTVLPGHGAASLDLPALIEANRAALERITDTVERHADGHGSEEVLALVCAELGVAVMDVPRYHLNFCTVAAHLGYLRSEGRLEVSVAANRLLWTRG